MNILYKVIEEHIDHLIEKKKRSIERYAELRNEKYFKKKVYTLKQEINYLQVCKHKLGELFNFIISLE